MSPNHRYCHTLAYVKWVLAGAIAMLLACFTMHPSMWNAMHMLKACISAYLNTCNVEHMLMARHHPYISTQQNVERTPTACVTAHLNTTLQAQDSSRLRIQSLQYRSQGSLGKDYFRTTIFFPANFVTLLVVIWLDGEHYFSAGTYTPNNIKL